jgi:uncharacterized membrane protein
MMSEFRDLQAIVAFVIVAAIFVLVPPLNETPVRALLGFVLVLFVPGYVFISALFPKENELDKIERLALSIGLSICIVVFIGLALNYTPWGIRLGAILLCISGFTLIFAAISAYRRLENYQKKDLVVDGR